MNYSLAVNRVWFKRKPKKHLNRKRCAWCGTRVSMEKQFFFQEVCGEECKANLEKKK